MIVSWTGCLVAVEVAHELADAALVLEDLALVVALVDQLDAHAGVQEGQLAQPLGQHVVVELDVREDRGARLEADDGAALVRGADRRQRRLGLAQPVFLLVELAVATDRQEQVLGQGVDDRDADAMQAAGDLVGGVVELTAGVQDGHDDLGRRATLLRMDIHRYSTAVVGDGDRLIGVDGHRYLGAMARQRLVDRVVDDLENHVVETGAVVGVSDVHAGPLSDGVETLQNFDFA